MLLTTEGDTYVATTTYEERAIPKAAGFKWDRDRKCWTTKDAEAAARLIEYADAETKQRLAGAAVVVEQKQAEEAQALELSRATDAEIDIPCPDGLAYLPYQRAGIAFAMARPCTLIGDEMGLGKTIQAIGVINADETIKRVLVICPASLKLNWRNELRRWLTRPMRIGIVQGGRWPALEFCDIIIINYDIVSRHVDRLHNGEWDLAIIDEFHKLKNEKAQRTKVILGTKTKTEKTPPIPSRRTVMLSGTPIVNRPIELWPAIHRLDPKTWPNKFRYAMRYCDGHKDWIYVRGGRQKAVWKFDGASNLDELQHKLRSTIMVRRLKKDVLTDLPPKQRQVIELPPNGAGDLIAAELEAYDQHKSGIADAAAAVELSKASDDPEDLERAIDKLKAAQAVAFERMSATRRALAEAKTGPAIDFIRDAVESSGKVVVMAHHKDVIRTLKAEFGVEAVVLMGDTPMAERQEAVDRFQSDASVKLFLGSIQAAGVGITLTAASHVIFVELDWVPGNMSQAEDRCHRIGQSDSVLVQHLVFDGSLDATMARTLIVKQAVIDAALDDDTPVVDQVAASLEAAKKDVEARLAERQQSTPASISAQQPATAVAGDRDIRELAETMSAEQIDAVHQGLQRLAGVCDGARELDGAGFNAVDTRIGKSLAHCEALTPKQAALGRMIVRKYVRQVGAELVERMGR